MADTAVAITAGTGTNIDTRTEATNGNHRQVVVVGDPSTNAGVAPVDATNGLSVTLTTAIPAGTAAIGKLAANSGVDIGDVNAPALEALIGNVALVSSDDALAVRIHPDGVNANGQAVMTGSAPVVIASDQSAIPAKGDIAHDSADTTAPVSQGGKAIAGLSGATLVAAADRTQFYAGLDGAQIVRPHCGLEDLISGVAAITDGSSTSVIASAGAGVKNYITTAIIANTSATAVTVDLRDGAAGTVKATLPVPANTSGVVCNLPVPLGFTAATAVCADPSASASTITVTLIGFKSKV